MQMGTIVEQEQALDIRFRCPACNGKLVVEARYVGERVACPRCSETISIPGTDRMAAPGVVQELERIRQTLADMQTKERKSAIEAAELGKALDEANKALGKNEKARDEDRVRFEETLKQEKASRDEEARIAMKRQDNKLEELRAAAAAAREEAAASKAELEDLRAKLEDIEKDKATLFEEVSALRGKVNEKDGLLRTMEAELDLARAGDDRPRSSDDFARGQMRLLEQQLADQMEALNRLADQDALADGPNEAGELAQIRSEAQRLVKAHSIQLEVQRLERKLREQQQAAADHAQNDLEQRQAALTDEVARLRGQLEAKDRSMREVVDGERTTVDLRGYANPTLEKVTVAAARSEATTDSEAAAAAEEEPPDGTLTPLKGVGDDILPRYTSPRPYYHELPQTRRPKSWVLTLGWVLAGFGIVAMILSPMNLAVVYGPPVVLALVMGILLWVRRRTPMVAGLVFLTLLIPALVWFGVEQGQFEGLVPDLGENIRIQVSESK